MFYRIKKDKLTGRYYLVKVVKKNSKRREKSIGPCNLVELIVNDWRRKNERIKVQAPGGGLEPPTTGLTARRSTR